MLYYGLDNFCETDARFSKHFRFFYVFEAKPNLLKRNMEIPTDSPVGFVCLDVSSLLKYLTNIKKPHSISIEISYQDIRECKYNLADTRLKVQNCLPYLLSHSLIQRLFLIYSFKSSEVNRRSKSHRYLSRTNKFSTPRHKAS